MSSESFGAIEVSIFLGIPLVWAIWELVKLRREQARDRELERERQARERPGP